MRKTRLITTRTIILKCHCENSGNTRERLPFKNIQEKNLQNATYHNTGKCGSHRDITLIGYYYQVSLELTWKFVLDTSQTL